MGRRSGFVRAVLALVYGVSRVPGATQLEFYIKTDQFRMTRPKIYAYVGNRLTQMNLDSGGGVPRRSSWKSARKFS